MMGSATSADEDVTSSQYCPSRPSGQMQLLVSLLHVPTSEHKAPLDMQLARALTGSSLHVNPLSSLSRMLYNGFTEEATTNPCLSGD